MTDIKFSILIPAYKRTFLYEALRSCLAQDYENFEIIVVDDASPERLEEIVRQFNDLRVKYFRNNRNCGAYHVVDNWNICLSKANGNFVICIGDDDKLLPNCLSSYFALIQKYPHLDLYHAWTELIDSDSNLITLQQPRPELETSLSLAWNRWNGRNRQYIGDFCFRKTKLCEKGGFYKLPFGWASDDISAIMVSEENGVANTQQICFQYRVNQRTISQTGNYDGKIIAIQQEKAWFEEFLNRKSKEEKMSLLDKKYYFLLKKELNTHFSAKTQTYLILALKSKFRFVFKFFRMRKKIGIGTKIFLRCLAKSLIR